MTRVGVGRARLRGQGNLVSLAIALVVVTAAAGVGVVVAGDALSGADRPAEERRVAVALSERLVNDPGLTARPNVLDATRVRRTNATSLRGAFPVARGTALRIRLGNRTLATAGDPEGGTSFRRVVLVRRERAATLEPRVPVDDAVVLPRRTDRVRIGLSPPAGTTVRTVRANGRVALHDPSGLRGNFTVRVSRFETTRLAFDATDPLPRGSVRVTYFPARTTKAVLEVTVDADG